MNPLLIAALIQQVAIPELVNWLKSRSAAGQQIDDAAILARLQMDVAQGNAIGQAWLDSHPTD